MSDLFRLKGKLRRDSFTNGFSSVTLHGKEPLKISHIRQMADAFSEQYDFYKDNSLIEGALISVKYVDVVPKSRRVQSFFKVYRGKDPDSFIVGAKIINSPNSPQHVITYFVPKDVLRRLLDSFACVLAHFSGADSIDKDLVRKIGDRGSAPFENTGLNCRYVARFLADCSNVEEIDRPRADSSGNESRLVTIYHAGYKVRELLKRLNIGFMEQDVWGDYSVVMNPEHYRLLIDEAGFFVAMSEIHDKEELKESTGRESLTQERAVPVPANEPTIGVIDTSYDEEVYFHQWVNVDDRYLVEKPTKIEDYVHGTEVCSVLVDGPALNPSLDDHCGRFKVRLFPVSSAGKVSWINVAQSIKEMVAKNPDIHVWNLSLGSEREVDENYISPMGSILDELQVEHPNVLFVVAGTNLPKDRLGEQMRVGSPADSINSLVVNSVTEQGAPTNYSRMGPVLSFFRKPDVSYYGGDAQSGINVMVSRSYEKEACGTSFAAPWIARKACFMMDVMGFTREETKALLIDSTLSFDKNECDNRYVGYGVVPKTIEEVIKPRSDEIRFIIKGTSESYYTSTYDLPIPVFEKSFPYKARVVMASTLKCDRDKGVDYTCEELGLSFGRMKKGKIVAINGDTQEDTDSFTNEETARSLFRKWDNVKVVNELLRKKRVPAKMFEEDGLWGLRITSKLRNDSHSPERNTKFAVVVTMKEIYGQDRSNAFERLCLSRGWIVERITVENKVEMYNIASSDIEWQ